MTFLKLSYVKSFRSTTAYLNGLLKHALNHLVPSHSAVIFAINVMCDTCNNYKLFYVILFIYLFTYLFV